MLNKKVALITGGARGIGRAIALKLAGRGADIAILDAGSPELSEQTADELRALGVRALAIQCDITDYEQVVKAVARVKEELGGVDILVNNAGITRDKLALRMSPEDFDAVLSVNLKGTFLMIKALYADFMKKRAGRIVNIASISGLMGNAGQANYSASKAGVVGLTKTIARELASRGVTCNAVAPGFIETPMTANMNQDALEEACKSIPLRRMGKPEDVANVVAFLASDDAAYITGSVVNVDGGFFMR
ncbi:MAG: 3-oxoacyl-[Clostridia bacterium]|nr:3-oxoacyl-[acyl-carrier-protein] reductase [Clostridia bacterium]